MSSTKIYLARASHTVDTPEEISRVSRHLSLQGRQVARAVGVTLMQHGDTIDSILASSDFAAIQTAELLADRLDYIGEVRVAHGASGTLSPRALADTVLAAGGSVLLVGEEPWLAALGAFLLGTPSFPPSRPAQISLIERGMPVWMLHPETRSFAALTISLKFRETSVCKRRQRRTNCIDA
jgi:phosphohistidine phosphatase SixA